MSTPAMSMGVASVDANENWNPSSGTTFYSGQDTYRGDVAMIRMNTGKYSGTSIYRGWSNSNSSSLVKSMWSRASFYADGFIAGGQTTGEISGWFTTAVGTNISHFGPTARNVVVGCRPGTGIDHGDSGGSVFTLTTGGVRARGTIGGFGIDICGAAVYYTDIRVFYVGLPGFLKIG